MVGEAFPVNDKVPIFNVSKLQLWPLSIGLKRDTKQLRRPMDRRCQCSFITGSLHMTSILMCMIQKGIHVFSFCHVEFLKRS